MDILANINGRVKRRTYTAIATVPTVSLCCLSFKSCAQQRLTRRWKVMITDLALVISASTSSCKKISELGLVIGFLFRYNHSDTYAGESRLADKERTILTLTIYRPYNPVILTLYTYMHIFCSSIKLVCAMALPALLASARYALRFSGYSCTRLL